MTGDDNLYDEGRLGPRPRPAKPTQAAAPQAAGTAPSPDGRRGPGLHRTADRGA
jgi:hypothetical protein